MGPKKIQKKDPQKHLIQIAKAIETLIKTELELTERPAMALALVLPPDYNDASWITNVSRKDGIELLEETALKMRIQSGTKGGTAEAENTKKGRARKGVKRTFRGPEGSA